MNDKDWDDYVTGNPMSFYGQMSERLKEEQLEIKRQEAQRQREYYAARNRKAVPEAEPSNTSYHSGTSVESAPWSIGQVIGTIVVGLFIWAGITTSDNWILGAFIGFITGIVALVVLVFLFKLLGWLLRLGLILLGLYFGYLILSAMAGS